MTERMALAEIPLWQMCEVEWVDDLRLMELGFYPGSSAFPMYECAGGGTRVYRVKGTLIALRNKDSAQIQTRVVE